MKHLPYVKSNLSTVNVNKIYCILYDSRLNDGILKSPKHLFRFKIFNVIVINYFRSKDNGTSLNKIFSMFGHKLNKYFY